MSIATEAHLLATYIQWMASHGRTEGIGDHVPVIRAYTSFLSSRSTTPRMSTTADVEAFRAHLTTPAATADGVGALAASTQATRLGVVRAYHRWLHRRNHTLLDPAISVSPVRVPRRPVVADELSVQEIHAFFETASAVVERSPKVSHAWAVAVRDLAMLALAVATGRRSAGLCSLQLAHLDVETHSLRVEREKGFHGRVLPVIPWAVTVAKLYRDEARPLLAGEGPSPWLFPGRRHGSAISQRCWDDVVRALHRATCARCPDLTELPGKRISTHSLRVTFAEMLFRGGCGVRVISELMLHRRLSTTVRYTPIHTDDLRRAMIAAHPRA